MSLEARFSVPSRGLDLDLTLAAGHTLALLGPNGSGKSSVLDALAGLLTPDEGSIALEGRTLWSGGTGEVRDLPVYDRGISLLAQEPLLFGHMSVLGNVAFGPRSRGVADPTAAARHWLDAFGAGQLAARRPGTLSGGQAARVALARALAPEPALLLLDEPLATLDVDVAATIRDTLADVLVGRTAILVTHDLLDVLMLADEVAVMDAGSVVESGATHDVVTSPRSPFAARLFGLNLVHGSVAAGDTLVCDCGEIRGEPSRPLRPGERAFAAFRPASVAVHITAPGGSPRNVLSATVSRLEPQGAMVRVVAGDLAADVTAEAVSQLNLRPGTDVRLVIKAAEVALYPE